jgi:hypothetical protein
MNRENLTHEPVEVKDFRKITNLFRGICGLCLKLIKKILKITTLPTFQSFLLPQCVYSNEQGESYT